MGRLYLISLLVFLFSVLQAQQHTYTCHAACQNCVTSDVRYYNCTQCPTNFKNNGTPSNGIVNCQPHEKYTLVYDSNNISISNTGTVNPCGSFYNPPTSFGRYGSDEKVMIWSSANPLPAHFTLRVRLSVLFILNWTGSDSISVFFNSSMKKDIKYDNFPNLNTSFCDDTNIPNRFGILDTSDISHSQIDIDITVQSSPCNLCPGPGCQGCNWMIPVLYILIQKCNETCRLCYGPLNTNCTACNNISSIQYVLSNRTCFSVCLPGFYKNDTNMCDSCQANCSTCVAGKIICDSCYSGYVLFPPQTRCLDSCPQTYYFDTYLNSCNSCDTSCKICTGYPSPCSVCNPNYFHLGDECPNNCPYPLVEDKNNWICQDCEVYCVRMTLSQYIPPGGNGLVPLYFDLNFTFAIDWPNFNYSQFQSLVFTGSMFSASNMNITYYNISSRAFRISIEPFSYAFIINQSVSITVRAKPDSNIFNYTSIDTRPFHNSVFDQSLSTVWTYLRPPNMTDTQYSIISTLSTFSTTVNDAFIGPGVQQFKKFGFLLLILNSMQITSCLILLNTVLPQNLYQGIRFFASLIFFDVPSWQSQSYGTKYFFMIPDKDFETRRRRLLTQVNQFYFRRVGFSGLFLFDSYWQIILIVICYILLITCILISKKWKKMSIATPYFYSALNAFHEIAVMYFTITIVFEIVYFNSTKLKWASIIICFLINLYYFLFQVRIYYVLLQYPSIPLTSRKFQQYVIKYSYYLKHLRFDEDTYMTRKCSIFKFLVRPHNYHIISYIKKFFMMLAFPLFYDHSYAQISILIVIQIIQIIRISVSKPYIAQWRNICKIFLQCILLTLFIFILLIQLIIVLITNQGANVNLTWAHLYFTVGWVCFALVFVFNIGYLIIFFLNWYKNCTQTNKQILEQSRRMYYFKLYNDHQVQNKQVPMSLLNEWVNKGNLNKRSVDNLPIIQYRIQYYSIIKSNKNYLFDFKVIFSISMDTEYNYKQDSSNIIPTQQLEASEILITPKNDIYQILHGFFTKYADKQSQQIIIKTFITVKQKNYKFRQNIEMDKSKMYQEIEIYQKNNTEPEIRKVNLLQGFPIKRKLLSNYSQQQQDIF